MPVLTDILTAKQLLSTRLLRAHLSSLSGTRRLALRVADVVVNAGRNVHAVGVGRKVVEGKATGERCVRLYVVQKVAPSLLTPRDRLPTEIDGVPVQSVEGYLISPLVHQRSRPM